MSSTAEEQTRYRPGLQADLPDWLCMTTIAMTITMTTITMTTTDGQSEILLHMKICSWHTGDDATVVMDTHASAASRRASALSRSTSVTASLRAA